MNRIRGSSRTCWCEQIEADSGWRIVNRLRRAVSRRSRYPAAVSPDLPIRQSPSALRFIPTMPLRISFNLGDADLRHFEAVAQQTQASARLRSAESIVAAAREVLESAERAQLAEFVRARFLRLRAILEMALDTDWPLSAEDSQRTLNALACFSSAQSDTAATVGFLDHAIMVELVSRDLEHDLEAYRDFCVSRESQSQRRRPGADQDAQREQWLQQRREALQQRMHARRERTLDQAGSSVRRLFSLFGL